MSRVLLFLIAIPLILILAAAILIPIILDKDQVLSIASQKIEEQTGARLSVGGEVDLSIFPTLGVKLGQVALDMPGEEETSLAARELEIGLQFVPLLSNEVVVDTVYLDGVAVKTVSAPAPAPVNTSKYSREELEEYYAKRTRAKEEAGQVASTQSTIAVPLALNVASLVVTDSRLETTEAGGDTSVLEIVELRATDLNLDNRPIPLSATVRMPGETPMTVTAKGDIAVDQTTQIATLTDMAISVEGALAETVALTTSGSVEINNEIADLTLDMSIADTRANGKVRYASFESPQIDAKLSLNEFTPALLALAGTDAAAAEQTSTDEPAEPGDTAIPVEAIRAMDTRAALTIDRVEWDPHVVTNLKAKLRVMKGTAYLSSVTGEVHGGKLDMKASLNAKNPVARVNTEGKLTKIDIAQVLESVESQPIATGKVDLDWKLNGQGNVSSAVTNTLKGPINLTASDTVLKDMSVEQMMCDAIALVNQESLTATFPTDTPVDTLSIKIQMAKGQANLKPLKAELSEISLNGTGYFALETMSFDATFKARVKPGLEKIDPACRVNERITSVKWPVNCAGDITGEPGNWCSVDTGEIIADLAENELKRKAAKEVEDRFGEDAGKLLKGLLGN